MRTGNARSENRNVVGKQRHKIYRAGNDVVRIGFAQRDRVDFSVGDRVQAKVVRVVVAHRKRGFPLGGIRRVRAVESGTDRKKANQAENEK